MLYLDTPPAGPQPVEIRDIGGYVHLYEQQTSLFRAQGREVRLVYCRSACTMALALPKACVYPHSKLFFHMAFNPKTGERREQESAELFAKYPKAVQARLGRLEPQNKMLTGTELIGLGVPECGVQPSPTMIAKGDLKPKPVTVASVDPSSLLPGTDKPGRFETAKAGVDLPGARGTTTLKSAVVPLPPARPEPSAVAALVQKATRFTGSALAGVAPNSARFAPGPVDLPLLKPKHVASAAQGAATVAQLFASTSFVGPARKAPEAPPIRVAAKAPLRTIRRGGPDRGPATTASIPERPGLVDTAKDTVSKVSGSIVNSVSSLFR
jgi:hypothetical protein